MTYSFNLVDQPWIPCLALDAGTPRDVSLRDALVNAHELREIAGASPLVTLSLHRLLLAVLHRVFGPADAVAWNALWAAGHFDPIRIDAYLDRWRDRFDLFDTSHPFYQAASIVPVTWHSAAKLAHELSSGNNAVLFDHHVDSKRTVLSPAEAARCLVAYQTVSFGGTISLQSTEASSFKHAKDAPIARSIVFLVHGDSLEQTLLLNLHQYHEPSEAPFKGQGADAPAWERESETSADSRYPSGYLDILTWQSRRIRLLPAQDEVGPVTVSEVSVMKGESFPEGYDLHGKDPMLAFRKHEKTNATWPWSPLTFRADRLLWRDSAVFLQVSGSLHARPRMLTWLAEVDRRSSSPLNLHALALVAKSGHNKPEFWRHERLPLPQAYLHDDKALFDELRAAVDVAEDAGRLLGAGGPFARCAEDLGIIKPKPNGALNSQDRDRLKDFVCGRGAGRHYWAAIDLPFRSLMEQLPGDATTDAYGDPTYGATQRPVWAGAVRQAAWTAFHTGVDGLYASPRGIKAVAIAESDFTWRLSKIIGAYTAQEKEVTA